MLYNNNKHILITRLFNLTQSQTFKIINKNKMKIKLYKNVLTNIIYITYSTLYRVLNAKSRIK